MILKLSGGPVIKLKVPVTDCAAGSTAVMSSVPDTAGLTLLPTTYEPITVLAPPKV